MNNAVFLCPGRVRWGIIAALGGVASAVLVFGMLGEQRLLSAFVRILFIGKMPDGFLQPGTDLYPVANIALAVFFYLLCLVLALQAMGLGLLRLLVPRSYGLELDSEGFTEHGLFWTNRVVWADVQGIEALPAEGEKISVADILLADFLYGMWPWERKVLVRFHADASRRAAVRTVARRLYRMVLPTDVPLVGVLRGTYGQGASSLVKVLRQYCLCCQQADPEVQESTVQRRLPCLHGADDAVLPERHFRNGSRAGHLVLLMLTGGISAVSLWPSAVMSDSLPKAPTDVMLLYVSAFAALFALMAFLSLLHFCFTGLKLDNEGVTVRRFLTRTRVPWSAIERFVAGGLSLRPDFVFAVLSPAFAAGLKRGWGAGRKGHGGKVSVLPLSEAPLLAGGNRVAHAEALGEILNGYLEHDQRRAVSMSPLVETPMETVPSPLCLHPCSEFSTLLIVTGITLASFMASWVRYGLFPEEGGIEVVDVFWAAALSSFIFWMLYSSAARRLFPGRCYLRLDGSGMTVRDFFRRAEIPWRDIAKAESMPRMDFCADAVLLTFMPDASGAVKAQRNVVLSLRSPERLPQGAARTGVLWNNYGMTAEALAQLMQRYIEYDRQQGRLSAEEG